MENEAYNAVGQPAGFWLRAGAKAADSIITNLIVFFLVVAWSVVDTLGIRSSWLVLLVPALFLILTAMYFAYFTSEGRQTLGYRLAGIKVSMLDGQPMPMRQGALRAVINVAFSCLYLVGYADYLAVAFKHKRALHDFVTRTAVVRVERPRYVMLGFAGPVLIAFCVTTVFLLVRPFFMQTFYTPSSAMTPTLTMGDRFFVNKLVYRLHGPQRGDIIVYLSPPVAGYSEVQFVKRVVGLPGDVIAAKDGALYLDGRRMREEYIKEPLDYTVKPVTIPNGKVFLLGDNRNNSMDSHVCGPISNECLTGRAMYIYWPKLRSLQLK